MPTDPFPALQSFFTGEEAAQFMSSPPFLLIKFVFITLSIFFLLHMVYLLSKTGKIKNSMRLYRGFWGGKPVPPAKDEFVKAWEKITGRMNAMREAEYKLAVIEADKLFDELLKRMAYKGKDMNERLQQITQEQISNIDEIWTAHKIRNLLAHDPNYTLSFSEAQAVIQSYEDAFRELHILD